MISDIILDTNDYEDVANELARRDFLHFILATKKNFKVNWHHKYIANKLQDFIDNKIKHLMVFLPTQTGKSEMSSRRLPAYILGKYPDKRVCICSYSDLRASRFNRNVQNIMVSPEYQKIFPDTRIIKTRKDKDRNVGHLRNVHEFNILNHNGAMIAVGVGGGLAGDSVDYLILDDMVKDRSQAVSIAYQTHNNEWWDAVATTRLDNNGKILFVNTRWDEDDLAGYAMKAKEFDFEVVLFPALKVNNNNPHDPRKIGEALWPEKHSRERYEKMRKKNPVIFQALQQQDPGVPTEILVYPQEWTQIQEQEMPDYSKFYGLDFGYSTAPDCLVEIQQKGNQVFARELFYQTGKDIANQSALHGTAALAQKIINVGAQNGPIYCDKSQPQLIDDLRYTYKINAQAAVGGPGSLLAGIQYMESLEIHLTADSVNGWMEKKKYQYPCGPDNRPIKGADPVDDFNHFMDAFRYGVYSRLKLFGAAVHETQEELY